jgi:NAD(P)-dependent dehydrogenase (short-subunit alcohol dehydrogenase family)
VTSRSLGDLRALAEAAAGLEGRIVAHEGDVTDAARMGEIVATIERVHGPIALAFFNAGVAPYMRATRLDLAAFRKAFDVNLFGVLNGLEPVLAAMMARRKGQVALCASLAGYGGLPRAAAYGASKAAVIHMAEALKFDLDNCGILLQLVNPGFVDTPLTRKNDFPMPTVVSADVAGRRIVDGFARDGFEITFPRRLAWTMKALNLLPYPLYFRLVARATGWTNRSD